MGLALKHPIIKLAEPASLNGTSVDKGSRIKRCRQIDRLNCVILFYASSVCSLKTIAFVPNVYIYVYAFFFLPESLISPEFSAPNMLKNGVIKIALKMAAGC